MKKLLALMLILPLMACTSTVGVPQVEQRTVLQLPQTPPLALQPVKFKVVETNDNQTMIALTKEEYIKLSQDMQKIQTKLLEQYTIIQDNLKYYNTPTKK